MTDKCVVTVRELQRLDPYEFEKVVADVWKAKGFDVAVRDKSGDRGIDVEAIKENYKVLIQAKRYSSGNKVGSQEVRRYATLYQQVPDANEVVIVTSGRFTSEALTLSQDLGVSVIDGQGLADMMDELNIRQESKKVASTQNSSSGNSEVSEEAGAFAELGALIILWFVAAIVLNIIYAWPVAWAIENIIDPAIFWFDIKLVDQGSYLDMGDENVDLELTWLGFLLTLSWVVGATYITWLGATAEES